MARSGLELDLAACQPRDDSSHFTSDSARRNFPPALPNVAITRETTSLRSEPGRWQLPSLLGRQYAQAIRADLVLDGIDFHSFSLPLFDEPDICERSVRRQGVTARDRGATKAPEALGLGPSHPVLFPKRSPRRSRQKSIQFDNQKSVRSNQVCRGKKNANAHCTADVSAASRALQSGKTRREDNALLRVPAERPGQTNEPK